MEDSELGKRVQKSSPHDSTMERVMAVLYGTAWMLCSRFAGVEIHRDIDGMAYVAVGERIRFHSLTLAVAHSEATCIEGDVHARQ